MIQIVFFFFERGTQYILLFLESSIKLAVKWVFIKTFLTPEQENLFEKIIYISKFKQKWSVVKNFSLKMDLADKMGTLSLKNASIQMTGTSHKTLGNLKPKGELKIQSKIFKNPFGVHTRKFLNWLTIWLFQIPKSQANSNG